MKKNIPSTTMDASMASIVGVGGGGVRPLDDGWVVVVVGREQERIGVKMDYWISSSTSSTMSHVSEFQ